MLHEKLECYRRSVRLAEELSKEGARWPRGLGYLYDQLRRAMASVVLNTAEGNARRSAAERRRFFEIARASAVEVSACIDLACSFGLMPPMGALSLKSRLTEVSKMLWGLMKR
ncbi:MAG: four helix bundle protein [bacterium]